eukprot:TRINITY_DN4178_c0_g2_i1.p1 TRINITY_DN4178_c0_g2~~TRINITY_DN4178_c0_g2_i1.p1  ORF type:complete len:467 (-),score=78.55 TRINITY_DN4178_c0_g2_i1:432-1805(-)
MFDAKSTIFQDQNGDQREIPVELRHLISRHKLQIKRVQRVVMIPTDVLLKQNVLDLIASSIVRLKVLVTLIPLKDYKTNNTKNIKRLFNPIIKLGNNTTTNPLQSSQTIERREFSITTTEESHSCNIGLREASVARLINEYNELRKSIQNKLTRTKDSLKSKQSRIQSICFSSRQFIKKVQHAIQVDTSKHATKLKALDSSDVVSSFEAFQTSVSHDLFQHWRNRRFKRLSLIIWVLIGSIITLCLQAHFISNSVYIPPPPKVELDTGKCMHIESAVCPYISSRYVSFAFDRDVYKESNDYGVTIEGALDALELFNQNGITVFLSVFDLGASGMDIEYCEEKYIQFMCELMFPACFNDCSESNACTNACVELEQECGLSRQTVWEKLNDPNMKTLLSYTQPPAVIASIEMLGLQMSASCFNPAFFSDPPHCSSPEFIDETNLKGNCSVAMHPEEIFG